MEFAFLDESGDLGKKGSKNLVLTLVCTSENKRLSKIIRTAKQRLLDSSKGSKWLAQHGGELKYYGFPDKALLKRTLENMLELRLRVYFLVFKKDGNMINPDIKKMILGQLFMHIIHQSNKRTPEKILADMDFFNKTEVNRFMLKNYSLDTVNGLTANGKKAKRLKGNMLFSKIDEKTYQEARKNPENILIRIVHKNSCLSDGLQAADLFSGALFDKFEKGESRWDEMFKKSKRVFGFGITEK